jgi:hypothetical protein
MQMTEFKGSKRRSLARTEGPPEIVAALSKIARPFASVGSSDLIYLPKGSGHPKQAKLGEVRNLLGDTHREALTAWWLAVREHDGRKANTPNWDIASHCDIEGRRGLMLIEANAHSNELSGRQAKKI